MPMYVNRTSKNNPDKNLFLTAVAMIIKVSRILRFTIPSTCQNFIAIHLTVFEKLAVGRYLIARTSYGKINGVNTIT